MQFPRSLFITAKVLPTPTCHQLHAWTLSPNSSLSALWVPSQVSSGSPLSASDSSNKNITLPSPELLFLYFILCFLSQSPDYKPQHLLLSNRNSRLPFQLSLTSPSFQACHLSSFNYSHGNYSLFTLDLFNLPTLCKGQARNKALWLVQ